MRYGTLALLGVAICSAAAAAVAWCTYALTRTELCVLYEDAAWCTVPSGGLAAAIALLLLIVVPLGSRVFAARSRPHGTGLGVLSWGLALTAAGGAALISALGTANGTPAETTGFVVGFAALCVGPLVLIAGIASTGVDPKRARAKQEARRRKLALQAEAAGLSGHRRLVAPPGARPAADPSAAAIGTLAAQLAAIAAARKRTTDDATAAKLRQLDDLRASGLLSADEHAAKRRELLDAL